MEPGIKKIYLALADLMKEHPVEEKTVNILGLRIPKGRDTELVRLLEKKGVRVVNVILSFCSPSDISRAPGAQLNLVLEHNALLLAEKMYELYGIEYVYCERPYAPDSVALWYRILAKALNIDLDHEINLYKQVLSEMVSRIRGRMDGKTCSIGVLQGRSFDIAGFMIELGLKPVLFTGITYTRMIWWISRNCLPTVSMAR